MGRTSIFRFFVFSSTVLAALSFGSHARAFDLQRLHAGYDAYHILGVEAGRTQPERSLDVGWLSQYDADSLVLARADGTERSLVRGSLASDLGASYGILPFLSGGLLLPVVAHLDGQADAESSSEQDERLTGLYFGDVALRLKASLAPGLLPEDSPFALGFAAQLTIPSGPTESFAGDGGVGSTLMALLGVRTDDFRLACNLGYRFRPASAQRNLRVGDELLSRLGASYALGPVEPGAALHLATSTSNRAFDRSHTWLELLAGVQIRPFHGFRVGAGASLGILDGFGTPTWRALIDTGFTWEPDARVEPSYPSTRPTRRSAESGPSERTTDDSAAGTGKGRVAQQDAVIIGDGTDPDPDGDGVRREEDACPDLPETLNGFEDADGCPDTIPPVRIDGRQLVTEQPFAFEKDGSLAASSQTTVVQLARFLIDHPELIVLRLEPTGPGGPKGRQAAERAARVVRAALAAEGVAPDILMLGRPRAGNELSVRIEIEETLQGIEP